MGRGAGGPALGGPGACGAELMGRVDLDMFPIICRALILLFCGSIDASVVVCVLGDSTGSWRFPSLSLSLPLCMCAHQKASFYAFFDEVSL